jgi:hypothetical protein
MVSNVLAILALAYKYVLFVLLDFQEPREFLLILKKRKRERKKD